MNARVDKLRSSLEEPLLVTNPTNVHYLSGFTSSNAALLVDPDTVTLFTDFRYANAASDVDGVEFVETPRALLPHLATRLNGRLGFESAFVSYEGYRTLEAGNVEPVPRPGAVEKLRAIKDDDELAALRRACEITDRVFDRLADEKFVGRTEQDVAWTLAEIFHDEGAHQLSFEFVVASGPNAAKPHSRAGVRTIGRNETVVIDAGCVVDGYASDYTRTFATGPLGGDVKEAYSIVLHAQGAALEGIRAGISGAEADGLAREIVDATQFKGTFGHGLGHGLGLEVHEAPRLSAEASDTLVPGNVVTVEPGIYLAGLAGIRIEDDVVVTEDGIENMTQLRKDLIEVG